MLFLIITVDGQQKCLLIFQDIDNQQLTDVAGMNVAHQLLTALIQKDSAAILVALEVWNHVVIRGDRFLVDCVQSKSASHEVKCLVEEINNKIKSGVGISSINATFNDAWYQKECPILAGLHADKYKAVLFDYFCAQLNRLITQWTAYFVDGGYLLLVPQNDIQGFNLSSAQRLTQPQLLERHAQQSSCKSLVSCLSALLQNQYSWNIYLTGHGNHIDKTHHKELIAGMTIDSFQKLLVLLNEALKTNVFVYSSCYSSGMHLIDPYKKSGGDLLLNYPVIATCLTDAPVYVFGLPAGLKLPPYDATFCLEPQDVSVDGLGWYVMQKFNDFCKYSVNRKNIKKIAQSVMVYQECLGTLCDLAKIENIPLVRKPHQSFFVPVDTQYVDCIVHDSTKSWVSSNKSGILWYTKQYHGALLLQKRIPQFISMLPGDGVIWVKKINISDFSMIDFISQAFFEVEDIHNVQIFLCDQLIAKQATVGQFMIIPKSSWLARDIKAGTKGVCIYQQGTELYSLAINGPGAIQEPTQLTKESGVIVQKLWHLLRQDSKYQPDEIFESILSVSAVQDHEAFYQKLLQACREQNICM